MALPSPECCVTIRPGAVPLSPCPFATAAGPAPCIKLASATGGMAVKTMANHTPVLLQSTTFITIPGGAGAPVPATVTSPGQVTVQGS